MSYHVLPTTLMALPLIDCQNPSAEDAAAGVRSNVHGKAEIVITSQPSLAGPNLLSVHALFGALLPLRSCSPFFRQLKDTPHSWEVIQ
jgi:hypothetical protein